MHTSNLLALISYIFTDRVVGLKLLFFCEKLVILQNVGLQFYIITLLHINAEVFNVQVPQCQASLTAVSFLNRDIARPGFGAQAPPNVAYKPLK